MSKLFSHAGVSRLNGSMKVRFANDALRVKVLAKNGHKDIDIVELKSPMTKEDALAYLISIDFATQNGKTNPDVQKALEAETIKRSDTPKAANKERKGNKEAKKPKKAPVPKAVTSTVDATLEDAPF
jgi:hypothetical protein